MFFLLQDIAPFDSFGFPSTIFFIKKHRQECSRLIGINSVISIDRDKLNFVYYRIITKEKVDLEMEAAKFEVEWFDDEREQKKRFLDKDKGI